jgi:hypothetical protein
MGADVGRSAPEQMPIGPNVWQLQLAKSNETLAKTILLSGLTDSHRMAYVLLVSPEVTLSRRRRPRGPRQAT